MGATSATITEETVCPENQHGPWRDSESYHKIKDWLISHDRAGEHPVLKYLMRAD